MKPTSARIASVGTASAQGARPDQEDRAVHAWIEKKGWLLGVFDGHRGGATADKAAQELIPLFTSMLAASGGNIPAALRDTFASLNKMTRAHICGSTASIVFIPQEAQSVYLGVLGDSPIVVMNADGKVHIGPDHNIRTN